ncbi:hypothetical protein F6V25_07535 [Oryzomonas japonica]|uniref:Uncharacterized protein n=1 Tax=Oryzomonas japonica TaxID=2603858 RepID=A0A7J4ZRJ5_9BACT|nr:JAB domain-containing protein [Oryzomonas japonica]KAB0665567.1 hypothetical protein F6V25_07535 [Oryzomonas japonica]
MALDDLNTFADQVNAQNRDKTQALLNLQNVVGTNTDAYAGSLRLAGYTQVPPLWSTPEIRADAERKAVADDPAVAAMPPVTARFFANPDNAAVAHDDIGTFTQIEELAKNGFGPRNNAPISTLRFGTDRDRAEADYFAKEYGTKPFQALQGGLGKLATRLAFPVAGAVDAVNGDDYYKEFTSQLYDRFSRIQEESAADPSQSFGGKVVRSVEELVPLVLSGGFGMAAIPGQATNDTYDNLTARGVDPDTSLALAMKSGMTAYAMTKLPFGGTSLANSLVRGATLNPAFGAIDRGLEKAGLNYAGYTGQAGAINLLDPEAMAHELAMGLLFGAHHALQTGRPVVGDGLLESLVPFYDRYRAARRADALTGIGTAVRESKANNRAPELVQRHLSDVAAEHAGIDNAYVPVERWNDLFRSAGLDPARVAGETLANPGAYDEALATGADIVIPFREFTGKLCRLEQYGELVKDARLSPGELSLREAEARVQAVKANADKGGGFVEALKGMAARSREGGKGAESYRRVYDDLVGQQTGIGTERGAAEHNAHLVANAFRVLGTRAGVDPYELYSQYHLKLTRPMDNQQVLDHQNDRQELWQSIDTNKSLLEPLLRSVNDSKSEHRSAKIGNVQAWLAAEAGSSGVNIDGYHHSIDTFAIRHILKRHGDVVSEKKRGLVAVTNEDITSIPEIIATPDKVVLGARNKRNQDVIVYVKTMPDGSTMYIDEVRVGKKELATVSMRKYPATSRAESIISTLDSTAKNDGENNLSDVNALLQPAASHLAADGVKELYQREKPLGTDVLWADLKAPYPGSEARSAEPSKGDEPSTRNQNIPNTDDHANIKIFGGKDGSKKIEQPIVLTGKELGEHGDDISSLRKSATKWYQDNLQGKTTANRKDLGEIRFTQVGRQEIKTYSANPDKLRLVPALKPLIESGEYLREEFPFHPRKDGIVKFYIIESQVELAGKQFEVEIEIGEDARGNKFYDVFPDAREHETRKASKRGAASKIAGHSEALHEDNSTLDQSIAPSSGDVNIRILNTDTGQEKATASTKPANNDHVKKVVTGVLHSAITRIKTPADAAHIAFPLTKRAQEAAIAIVTDAKGNVLGVVQHSTGALDKTIMSPRDLLGVLHDFPGVAEVWFAHNHPTGDPEPSPADSETTSQMAALLDGSGITTRGMIVVGQEGGAVWTEGIGGRTKKIPLGSLNTDKERTHEITTYDREIVALPSSEPFTYIDQAIDYARSLGAGASGLIIADAKIRPVSFVPMSVAEMAKLKTGDPATGSSAIMSAFHKGNGASMIMVIPALPGSLGAVRNMVSFGTMFGAPLIDVIETRSGISFDKTGRMPQAGGQFFQGGNAPVSHDFVPAPDGRYVFGEITPEIGKIIRRQSAPILLRSGDAKEGKTHIERPERLKQIQKEGYDSAEKLVDDVVTHCDAIYKGERGNLLLAKKAAKNTVIYVQLNPSRYGDYYDVKTAVVTRGDFFDKKKPLWERAQTNPADNGSPMRNLSGQSGLYENILHQNREDVKRGYIRFVTNRTFEIGLLKDADLSTFIHESGHFFTEVLGDLAERSDAPRQIRDDYAALLAFAGVESRGDIRTEHHEKLARAFEAYIMEGRAPSVATRSLFQRMKAWMIGVYKDLTALHATLTPEVREVFDRMLATDAEIGRMRGTQEMRPLFAAAGDAGMSTVEFGAYRKETEQAGEQAKEQMLRKLMAEKSREQTSRWRDELAKLRDEVTVEAQAEPVYRALQEIIKGRDFAGDATPGLKLDRAVLARVYGEEFLKRLPKGSATDYLYAVQGGAHPELVAERYGFSSADEMIRAMMAAPPLGDFVVAEADARMRKRHGDLMRDGRMADEALKAVHNDQWAGVLRTEIGALRRKGGEDAPAVAVPPVAAFRQAAQERIAAKPVRTINPLLYLNGERTAASDAFDLLGTGDFNRAAAARSRQLLNHFLYSEAVTALGEVDAIRAEAARMPAAARSEMRGSGARPFRGQVEALLSRFGPAGAPRDEPLAPRESLRQFLDRLRRDEGIDLPIPAAILNEQSRTASYRDLTMDELRSVSATLHMIEHAAAVVNTARKGETRLPLEDAEKQLVEQLEASIPAGDAGGADDSPLSFLGQIREHVPEIDIPIVRPEALFERMDGHATSGPWHDLLWNPYNDAAHYQNRVRESVFPAIFALIRGTRIDRSKGRIFIEGLGGSLAKDEIVAIALNCGNERNLNLLMRGGIRLRPDDSARELAPETLQEILGYLSADEIAVVNGVWKVIGSLKPEVEALLRRQAGAVPVFMETRPLEIANGTLEGGFYPVTFDPRYAIAGEKSADAALPSRMFLRDWVGEGGAEQLSLDLENGVVRHLDRVVTRITLGAFAAQAHRLLKRTGVKAAITNRLGEPAHKNLLDWVTATLDRDTLGCDMSVRLENTSRVLRTSAAASIVAQQAADTVADIVTAASGGMRRLDVTHVVRGAFEYMRNPVAVHRFAVEASEYMRHLDHEIDRTMAGALDEPADRDMVLDDVQHWVIASRAGAAKAAAMVVWISGYREAQAKGMDGMEAVRSADTMSRMTPDAGRTGELSAAERTAKAHKLAMLIGRAMVRYTNATDIGRRGADQEIVGANRADGTTPFLLGMVATGIVKDVLENRQLEENDSFLPWFLSRMVHGISGGIPYVDELANHGEGTTTGQPPDQALAEAGKGANEAVQATLHAIGGKSNSMTVAAKSNQAGGIRAGGPVLQATLTGQYLDDLLAGGYAPSYPRGLAMGILNNRRYKR